MTSREVLEHIVLDAMQRGPVSMSFSGGRDSSLLLAVATTVARREGLPDPLPITMLHPSPESKEDEYQEAVIRHLGVHDWVRIDVGESLDVLGKVATDFYLQAGMLALPNAYLHRTMAQAAPQGTLFTGGGGDEVLSASGWRLAQVLTGRVRPRARDLALAGYACAPMSLRRRLMARKDPIELSWLVPDALRQLQARLAASNVWSRVRWDVGALYYTRSRVHGLSTQAMARVGSDLGVRIESPFSDERFVSTFASEVGLAGPRSREDSMRRLGSDVLPELTLSRRWKSHFGGMIWGMRFRDFVEDWDPQTLNPEVAELIEPEALREVWHDEMPGYLTMLLVQQAWLDQRAARAT